jgi:hypothetical protein
MVSAYAYESEYAKHVKMGDFKLSYDNETRTLIYHPEDLKSNAFYNKAECDEKFVSDFEKKSGIEYNEYDIEYSDNGKTYQMEFNHVPLLPGIALMTPIFEFQFDMTLFDKDGERITRVISYQTVENKYENPEFEAAIDGSGSLYDRI